MSKNELLFEAVIFDLDGVITKTAQLHNLAWEETFNKYLRYRENHYGESHRPFDYKEDYLKYIDGKPRYDGVAAFLKSKNINLPRGSAADSSQAETICGLGNRKNEIFRQIIKKQGVEVFPGTLSLIKSLRAEGIKLAVASSSKNCRLILEAAGLQELFNVNVDGIALEKYNLPGKPDPSIFRQACFELGVPCGRAVVVEDAVSGVQAAAAADVGCVIGVSRADNALELEHNGADIVVEDLSALSVSDINEWFKHNRKTIEWSLVHHFYRPEREKQLETLFTVGNGYMAVRGAMAESLATDNHYPGLYIAGVYNRAISMIKGKHIENEDLVNCPNWLLVRFKINNGDWFNIDRVKILSFERNLNLKTGVLTRRLIFEDSQGRVTEIFSSRFISMADRHLGGQIYSLRPLNYSANFTIKTGIFYDVRNLGVSRYRGLENKHLRIQRKGVRKSIIYVSATTRDSNFSIAEAVKLSGFNAGTAHNFQPYEEEGLIAGQFEVFLKENTEFRLEKLVGVFTSRETHRPLEDAIAKAESAADYAEAEADSAKAWKRLWPEIDIKVEGDRWSQRLIRLNNYHLMVTRAPISGDVDWGIPARGLHGEAYRGHIFWDEVFLLPYFSIHFPELAEKIMLYRYRRLPAARQNAQLKGYDGALFPWQSAGTGNETTPRLHLNPLSGTWHEDHSYLQKHISSAIAYNIWHHYLITASLNFLIQYGAEMLLEVAKFWASATRWDEEHGCYEIEHVMGPDEFHEKYPNSDSAGLKNNAYTNIMASWVLNKAVQVFGILPFDAKVSIKKKLGLTEDKFIQWSDISRKLKLPVSIDGIIEQFEGFFKLKEIDWQKYRSGDTPLERMDRVLKAAADSPDNYQILKQADTLMVFYLLPESEVNSIIARMTGRHIVDCLRKNFEYYFPRTSHGSTLSYIVHSRLAYEIDQPDLGWKFFRKALMSDYNDVQGGTTAEGIHTGVMAGCLMQTIQTFGGVSFSLNELKISEPRLPAWWKRLQFQLRYHRTRFFFNVAPGKNTLQIGEETKGPVEIRAMGKEFKLNPGVKYVFDFRNGTCEVAL